MERLTKLYNGSDERFHGKYICNHEKNCNDECLYNACQWREEATQKLAEYENAEEHGLLVRLPCKVDIGDNIYRTYNGIIYSGVVTQIRFMKTKNKGKSNQICFYVSPAITSMYVNYGDFGKNWFLTKSEALQALKEKEENQ